MERQYRMNETIDGTSIRNLFAKNLRRFRYSLNISQLELSTVTGLAHNFINDIEHEKKFVSDETIAKLAIAFKVEPYQLFLPEAKWNSSNDDIFVENFSSYIGMMVKEHSSIFIKDNLKKEPK